MKRTNDQNTSDPYHSEVEPHRPLYAKNILVVSGPQTDLDWFLQTIGKAEVKPEVEHPDWDKVQGELREDLRVHVKEWEFIKPERPLTPALWQVQGEELQGQGPQQLRLPEVPPQKDGPTAFLRFKLPAGEDALETRGRLNGTVNRLRIANDIMPQFPVRFGIDRVAGLLSRKGVGSPDRSVPQTSLSGELYGIPYLPLINWEAASRKPGEDGKGVTVMILDTAPDNPTVNQPYKYWLDLSEDIRFEGPDGRQSTDLPPEVDVIIDSNKTNNTKDLSHEAMEQYHGLLIASIVQDIAPEANIVLVKVLNDNGENLESSLRYALNRIYEYCTISQREGNLKPIFDPQKLVLNLSWGLFLSLYPEIDYQDMLDTCQKLCSIGVTVVAAAGNDTVKHMGRKGRKREFPAEPAAYGFNYELLKNSEYASLIAGNAAYKDQAFPTFKEMAQVIPVAAIHGPKGTGYATFSDFGSLAAPGESILIEIRGGSSIPVEFEGNITPVKKIVWSGTSFAAPQVAAAAALLLQKGLISAQVKGCLITHAEHRPLPGDFAPPLNEASIFQTHVPKLNIRNALDNWKLAGKAGIF